MDKVSGRLRRHSGRLSPLTTAKSFDNLPVAEALNTRARASLDSAFKKASSITGKFTVLY